MSSRDLAIDLALFIVAFYAFLTAALGIPAGLFVGWHILGGALAHLVVGIIAAILVAWRLRSRDKLSGNSEAPHSPQR